jgi:Gas vesicle protein G
MGLISGILLLPLAPVRGTVWLAERIQEQAERELYDESGILTRLMELEEARQAGEIDEEELAAEEDALLEALMASRARFSEEEV